MKKSRNSRRMAAALVSLVFCLLLVGCGVGSPFSAVSPTPVPSPTASPTPTPSPTPAPYIAVFGAEGSSAFAAGISKAAESGEFPVTFESGYLDALSAYAPQGNCVAIVFLKNEQDALPQTALPFFVFASKGQRVDSATPHLTYADAYAAETALSYALAYPPHETPVRLIGLFTSEQSRAYTVFAQAASNGSVFAKASFFAVTPAPEETPDPEAETPAPTPEPALAERLAEVFERFYPGMIDGVFAETGELAVAASEALASLGRDDMEVFSAATDAEAASLLSPLLVYAVGANDSEAGGLSYNAACAMLRGESVSPVVVLPQAFAYSPAP